MPESSSDPIRFAGLEAREHTFRLPLDHARPSGRQISVFAREVRAADKAGTEQPYLVFLQGGPGSEGTRPFSDSGWIGRAVKEFRVVLLDQRGTGRSTPIHAETLAAIGDARAQAEYLALHRQEQIVADCEAIRRDLCHGAPWTVLGQSWGGFLATHYLSAAPEGLATVLITGGLPPLEASLDDVYRATYRRVLRRNARYFERYPEDRDRLRTLTGLLENAPDDARRLPSGDLLSYRRLQQVGFSFGMSDGYETVHYLLELALPPGTTPSVRPDRGAATGALASLRGAFGIDFERSLPFARNPLFAVIHEAIYSSGPATRWSAARIRSEFPDFDSVTTPILTGEMIYPWMFDEISALAPMKQAAHLLAEKDDWAPLFDLSRLRSNRVPVAAAIYHDDMYVECSFSEAAADTIRGCRVWITNEYDHNGLRADGDKILERLLGMARGER